MHGAKLETPPQALLAALLLLRHRILGPDRHLLIGTAANAKNAARPPTNREAQPASPIEACLRKSLHDSYGLVTSTTIAALTQQATLFFCKSPAFYPPTETLSNVVFVRCDRVFGFWLIRITSLERRAWPPITTAFKMSSRNKKVLLKVCEPCRRCRRCAGSLRC